MTINAVGSCGKCGGYIYDNGSSDCSCDIPTKETAAGIVSYLASPYDVQQQYEKETGEKFWVNPVCHGELGFASWEYQSWLEREVIRLSGAR